MPDGFTKQQREEIKKQAVRFWQESENNQSQFFINTNDRQRMAHGLLPQDLADKYANRPDESSLAPPDFFINIQSIVAAFNSIIFAQKPYAKLSLYGSENPADERVKKAEAVLQYLLDLGEEEGVLDPVMHQAAYSGLGCTFHQWTTMRRRSAIRRDDGSFQVGQNGQIGYQTTDVVEYPASVALDIRRVRIDPSADCLANRKICGHEYITGLSDCMALNAVPYHWYSFDLEELKRSSFDRNKFYQYLPDENAISERGKETIGYGDKIVSVRSTRGLFRIPNGHDSWYFADLVVDIGNNNVVLGIKENDLPIPGWELYDFLTLDNELGRLFPMGLVEPAEDAWMMLFLTLNGIIDRNTRDTYDMYVGDKNALAGVPEYIPHEGGRIIGLDLMGSGIGDVTKAFTPMIKDRLPQQNFQLMAIFQNLIQQIMRLSDYIQGADPSRKETATAVTALMRGGQSLLLHMIDRMKRSYFKKAWQKKLILFNHFRGYQALQIYDAKGIPVPVTPGELDLPWVVDIETNAGRDRPDMVRRFIESLTLLLPLPWVDKYQLLRTFAEIMDLPNKERIIVDAGKLEADIARENLGLMAGAPLPVHPADAHEEHIKIHSLLAQRGDLPPNIIQNIAGHIQMHIQAMEEIKGNLANTKGGNPGAELAGGQPAEAPPTPYSTEFAQ